MLDAKKYDEAYIILEAIGNKDAVTDSMYARAMEYLEAKDYDSAYALLNQLGDTEKINESMYNRAVEFINAGDNKAAYEILYQISEYKDSKSKISSLIKENPKLEKLRQAPEEVVAKAIREMIRKEREQYEAFDCC